MDYQTHYDRLIERARSRQLAGYSERHHILPRCLGGGNADENLVKLTPEEHFVAHQLLAKIHKGNRPLIHAAWAMTRGRPGNKRFGWLRREFSKSMSAVWLGKKRAAFSEEHRKNISLAQIGKKRGPHTEAHKSRLAAAHAGKILTDEHRAKLSKAKAGKKVGAYAEKTCPHCGKIGAGGTMHRWHFDNCKEKS